MTLDTPQSPLALRPRDAAKSLGISPRTLWQLTKDGHIRSVRIGTGKRCAVLYSVAELQRFLAQRTPTTEGGEV